MKELTRYRAVVIGCGNIGVLFERERHRPKPATHAGAFATNNLTQLVALVDRDVKKLKMAGRLFPEAVRYRNTKKCLLMEKPDIVAIATGPASHYAVIKQCIESGVRMIVCEKPLASTLKEARAIEALVQTSRTTFVLNYQRTFFRLFKEGRHAISRGRLGRIQQVTCYYSNGLNTNGSHSIDAALFLLDDLAKFVIGVFNVQNRTHPSGDVNIDGIVVTKSGTTISLQSVDQEFYGINSLKIFGEKGSVFITDYGFTWQWYAARRSLFGKLRQLEVMLGQRFSVKESATAGALNAAIACHSSKQIVACDATRGRLLAEIVSALRRSAMRGNRAVSVGYGSQ